MPQRALVTKESIEPAWEMPCDGCQRCGCRHGLNLTTLEARQSLLTPVQGLQQQLLGGLKMGRRSALALLAVTVALAAVLLPRASRTLGYAWLAMSDADAVDWSVVGRSCSHCRLRTPPGAGAPQRSPADLPWAYCPALCRPLPGRYLRWGMRSPRAGCHSCRPPCCRRTCMW